MAHALSLARRARHQCRPNPMVGAVIVRDGRVLGEGWHHKPGRPHAEIEALNACSEDPRGATMYVTLEPCCHDNKRTAPCAPAVVAAGIERLVAATLDPYEPVRGKGFAELRAAGVRVEVGLLEREARILNQAFAWHAITGRPFTTLKLALTLDGRIADASGRSRWITGERARDEVQRLRSQMDAIVVGRATAEADDPALTVRLRSHRGPQPLRVVLGRLQNPGLKLLTQDPERTHIFVPEDAEPLADTRAHVHRVGTAPEQVLETLASLGVQRVLVEGGGRVAGSFLDAGLIQRVWLFFAPILLGDAGAAPAVIGKGRSLADALRLTRVHTRSLGPDLLVEGFLHDPLDLWEIAGAPPLEPARDLPLDLEA
jgi:diaminohydroxyphosphoribosylaminopyrimidine deaminase / 5-amino-6-(5-phosphoribosylamino)uracil reductase